jgi:hypothetical protein
MDIIAQTLLSSLVFISKQCSFGGRVRLVGLWCLTPLSTIFSYIMAVSSHFCKTKNTQNILLFHKKGE